MKKIYILLIVLFAGLLAIGAFFIFSSKKSTVTINNTTFNVEVAKTQAEREKGLSGRDSLENNAGMLFKFSSSDIHMFWMKDTFIPLDVIWINDGKIVEMTTLDPVSSEPAVDESVAEEIPSYTPKEKANYVLEINAGTSQELGFKVGDKVVIK